MQWNGKAQTLVKKKPPVTSNQLLEMQVLVSVDSRQL